MSTNEERREQEKRKQDAPIDIPQKAKEKKPNVTVHPKQPEQKPQTEEEAFMSYMNNLISNAVLDNESIKTKTVDVLKSLGQQLGLYMREVSRLKEEVEKLKKNSPEEKK